MWDLGGGTAKHWEKLWLHVFFFCFFFSQCIRRDFICAYFGHCEHTEYPVILGILTDFIGPIHWTACVGQLTAYEGPVQLRCGCGAFKCFQR